ncbi:RHS repeat protein [Chryseobacterium sp. YIM B08800]|uniref:RHS repeat protein n=1 Tax=Chryseobacterium sp. YIM B08800 TaxID=2984136 RepID=UPI002240C005|nr:RHS repeat-associated core domain-containing protein [Chryseobacterium sp. YIM B08800]
MITHVPNVLVKKLQFSANEEDIMISYKIGIFIPTKDHLGSIRLSYAKRANGFPQVLEENNYYPFGLKHTGYNTGNMANSAFSYKYNGKELQSETGMVDYGWRQYMPEIGRWNGIDQLSENYTSTSTYAYVANNPIMRFDVDGRWFNDDGTIDTSGRTPSYVTGKQYRDSFLGSNRNDGSGGSGGYNFTGNAAGSMYNYFVNGGSIDGISFKNGEARWWTLDEGENSMYSDYDGLPTGNTGGITMYTARFNTSSRDRGYFPATEGYNWGQIGNAATMGGIAYYGLEKGIYNKNYWVDAKGLIKSTKLLELGENGKFVRGVQGLRYGNAAAAKAASVYSVAGKVVGGIGVGITVWEIASGRKNLVGEGGLDLIMGGIGFTGWGAPVSLIYFGGKLVLEQTGNDFWNK